MSARTVTRPPGSPISLYEHALRLHAQDPDRPLPRGGRPLPDGERHGPRLRTSADPRTRGVHVAAVLDAHFGRPRAHASELVDAFHGLDVPLHPDHHVTAAALRADRARVRQTGRWLVRNSTNRDAAAVGLALLEPDGHEEDVPLIRTIGLLSDHFGPLAAHALRRRPGGGEALLWLAQRVAGWGRVHVVEALCEHGPSPTARAWLLRHGCDGDVLNGYFAGRLATTAHLHEAITRPDVDDALIDHTGRLLRIMAGCAGMGMTLESYPPAPVVLAAHVAHLSRQAPSAGRYVDAAVIADHLAGERPTRGGDCAPDERRAALVRDYLAVLARPEWRAAVRAGLDPDVLAWFVEGVATRRGLDVLGDVERHGEG
ncbi:hypothetical protein [Cellulomonas phragmiteti]|uniref:Uncharacterized protein n=1 Tax=Cellulomonas phragmiteti TaxID=478780 RepID=A0ABQ4DK60_9CELL|nr:hypothetical protein [Cellulomonas phragmiteti]GIG39321.1 hypothetical protein Cph01nite_10830 [Cellulomonas phragmiteti]